MDALGKVSIYSASSGEAVLMQDLWDQTGVGFSLIFQIVSIFFEEVLD